MRRATEQRRQLARSRHIGKVFHAVLFDWAMEWERRARREWIRETGRRIVTQDDRHDLEHAVVQRAERERRERRGEKFVG